MDKITTLTHGRHTLRAAVMNKVPTARAFLTDGAQGTVAEATGTDVETAIENLKQQLDDSAQENVAARRRDNELLFDVPTQAEYADALSVVKARGGQLAMLRAHALAGEDGMSAAELAEAAGYAGFKSANLQYAKLGRAIAEAVGCDMPGTSVGSEKDLAIGVVATPAGARENDDKVLRMHPELAEVILATPDPVDA